MGPAARFVAGRSRIGHSRRYEMCGVRTIGQSSYVLPRTRSVVHAGHARRRVPSPAGTRTPAVAGFSGSAGADQLPRAPLLGARDVVLRPPLRLEDVPVVRDLRPAGVGRGRGPRGVGAGARLAAARVLTLATAGVLAARVLATGVGAVRRDREVDAVVERVHRVGDAPAREDRVVAQGQTLQGVRDVLGGLHAAAVERREELAVDEVLPHA